MFDVPDVSSGVGPELRHLVVKVHPNPQDTGRIDKGLAQNPKDRIVYFALRWNDKSGYRQTPADHEGNYGSADSKLCLNVQFFRPFHSLIDCYGLCIEVFVKVFVKVEEGIRTHTIDRDGKTYGTVNPGTFIDKSLVECRKLPVAFRFHAIVGQHPQNIVQDLDSDGLDFQLVRLVGRQTVNVEEGKTIGIEGRFQIGTVLHLGPAEDTVFCIRQGIQPEDVVSDDGLYWRLTGCDQFHQAYGIR